MKKLLFFQLLLFLLLLGVEARADEPQGVSNVSTRSDVTSGKFNVSADFLVWFASEETDAIWANVLSAKVQNDDVFSTLEGKGATFDWDYGFRVGAGYHFVYDQWDTQLCWTWYQTSANSKVPNNDHLLTIFPQFFGGFINGDFANRATLDWNLWFNMFDWDLGRSYWISKSLSIRPLIGVKGGWIHQSLDSKWHTTSRDVAGVVTPVDYNAKENLKNNFWGVGPFGGINTKWKLGSSDTWFFNIFGDFSAASLWGRWIIKDVYKNPTPRKITFNLKNSDLGALMLRGFLGIGWDIDINQGLSHFAVRLGYEMQIWFNQLRIATFQQLRLHGDLTLQGGTLNCCFEF